MDLRAVHQKGRLLLMFCGLLNLSGRLFACTGVAVREIPTTVSIQSKVMDFMKAPSFRIYYKRDEMKEKGRGYCDGVLRRPRKGALCAEGP